MIYYNVLYVYFIPYLFTVTSQYTERGCAAQTQDGEQIKVNRKWIQVQNIYEVYEEGCAIDQSYPERRTQTLACYCRGDRCNAATTNTYVKTGIVVISLFVIFFS